MEGLTEQGAVVNPQVLELAEAFAEAGKPVGLICISPALAAKIYGPGVTCTIGNCADTAAALDKMGATHQECAVDDIVEDKARKLVEVRGDAVAVETSESVSPERQLVLDALIRHRWKPPGAQTAGAGGRPGSVGGGGPGA